MRLFDLPQAKHFCETLPAAAPRSGQSLAHLHASLGIGVTRLLEGTTRFGAHQAALLDSVERWLLYSLAHYRRAFDMLVPVCAPWAQITLYYSSFFAANAVLGMFGGWIGSTSHGTRVVDAERGLIGSQELKVHRKVTAPSGARGSHRVFWDIFYDATASISAWAPPALAIALSPVNGDFAWQITERNDINYDMFHAWSSSRHFHATFRPERLSRLDGPARLQLETTERMIRLALHFARELALPGNALNGLSTSGSRTQMQKRLVTSKVPKLVSQSALSDFLEL